MFLEDAGFDWKILGPDVGPPASCPVQGVAAASSLPPVDYVAWQCDQDAYACSGQKCSAQSILLAHRCVWRIGRCRTDCAAHSVSHGASVP